MITKKRFIYCILGSWMLIVAACSTLANAPAATVTPEPRSKSPTLPIKFSIQPSGISIQGEIAALAPLGHFAIGSVLPVVNSDEILVVFRDTKSGRDELYRIRLGRDLRIIVNGEIAVEVSSNGVVLLDVTEDRVETVEIRNRFQPSGETAFSKSGATPSPPKLGGSLKELLPDPGEIPNSMFLSKDSELSNEDATKQSDNPEETSDLYTEFGRITGYLQHYTNQDRCNELKSGLTRIWLTMGLYENELGAEQALESYVGRLDEPIFERVYPANIVGENAYIGFYNREECDPLRSLRHVYLIFQRYNAIGLVDVGSIPETVSDDYMLALATRLAQLMDANFASRAR